MVNQTGVFLRGPDTRFLKCRSILTSLSAMILPRGAGFDENVAFPQTSPKWSIRRRATRNPPWSRALQFNTERATRYGDGFDGKLPIAATISQKSGLVSKSLSCPKLMLFLFL